MYTAMNASKKGLRSFLGILNYAKQHIPRLGILLRPLYEKTNAHGDKRLKPSDYQIIREIKKKVQQLPDYIRSGSSVNAKREGYCICIPTTTPLMILN
ncbi:hypothetical protein Tco_1130967 [Tanacetum coccineum]